MALPKSIVWDGKPISVPGMYSGIPNEAYHGDICDSPSISTTGLKKLFHESPADFYKDSYLNPEREEKDDSSALIMGRAVHHLILGEPHFQKVYAEQPDTYPADAVYPDMGSKNDEQKKWTRAAKWCKAWEAERAEENRYILDKKEVDQIRRIAKSLSTNELVQAGVLNGLVERSLFYRDPVTGIWVKHRPDVIPTDSGDSGDLKTTISVDWDDLVSNYFKFGYYQQGAVARDAFKQVLNIDLQSFMLMFVEKELPNSVRPVIVKEIDLNLGAMCNRAALDIMARCLKEKSWPGPRSLTGEVVEYIEMAPWQKRRIANKLKLMGYTPPTDAEMGLDRNNA